MAAMFAWNLIINSGFNHENDISWILSQWKRRDLGKDVSLKLDVLYYY